MEGHLKVDPTVFQESTVSKTVPVFERKRSVTLKDTVPLRDYIDEITASLKNRPVVLKDAAQDWKAISKWTPQFFKEKYGSKTVPVFERKRSVTLKDTVPLRDYIDEITASNFSDRAKYLFSLRIPKEFPELLGDLEPRPTYWDPNWLDSKYLLPGMPSFKLRNITGLRLNIAGTGSPFPFLHYDDLWTQTFITQVHGRKDWILYQPDQTPYMYPSEQAENISRIPMEKDVDPIAVSFVPLAQNRSGVCVGTGRDTLWRGRLVAHDALLNAFDSGCPEHGEWSYLVQCDQIVFREGLASPEMVPETSCTSDCCLHDCISSSEINERSFLNCN